MTHLITVQLRYFTLVLISPGLKTIGAHFLYGLRRPSLSFRRCTHDTNRLSKRHALPNNHRPMISSSSSCRLKNEPNVQKSNGAYPLTPSLNPNPNPSPLLMNLTCEIYLRSILD